MISAKPVLVVALLALAGAAVAQDKADEQRIAELIEQLEDAEARDEAFHKLVAMGVSTVQVIRGRIERGEYTPRHIEALEAIGPPAVDTFPLLRARVVKNGEDIPELFRAMNTLAVFLPRSGRAAVFEELRDDLDHRLRHAVETQTEEWRHALAAEYVRAQDFQRPPLIDMDSSWEQLVDEIEGDSLVGTYRKELAAELLARKEPVAEDALPALLLRLRIPKTRHSFQLGIGTVVFRDVGPESNKAYAKAILSIDPTGLEAAEAHAYLIEHGDSYQRRESVMALRGFEEMAEIVTLTLAGVAENPSEQAATRYEAMTTLGMIGPAAKDAIPTLEKLAEHDDKQIAARAKAALRQVRGR